MKFDIKANKIKPLSLTLAFLGLAITFVLLGLGQIMNNNLQDLAIPILTTIVGLITMSELGLKMILPRSVSELKKLDTKDQIILVLGLLTTIYGLTLFNFVPFEFTWLSQLSGWLMVLTGGLIALQTQA